jgi:hypothetical protein
MVASPEANGSGPIVQLTVRQALARYVDYKRQKGQPVGDLISRSRVHILPHHRGCTARRKPSGERSGRADLGGSVGAASNLRLPLAASEPLEARAIVEHPGRQSST